MRKRTLAWLVLSLTVTFVLGGASLASGGGGENAGAAASSVGTTQVGTNIVFTDVFGGPNEAHQYTITPAPGGTGIKASTRDCCIAGDKWVSTLINQNTNATVGLVPKTNTKAGNGNTSTFTGTAKLGSPTNPVTDEVKLLVTYGDGVDSFAAGLDVQIVCSGGCSVTHDF